MIELGDLSLFFRKHSRCDCVTQSKFGAMYNLTPYARYSSKQVIDKLEETSSVYDSKRSVCQCIVCTKKVIKAVRETIQRNPVCK